MRTTLVFTFFRTLTLTHLEHSLYSLSRQSILPNDLLFFDNNTVFSEDKIRSVIAQHFPISRWAMYFAKHGNTSKQLSWNNNAAIRFADTETFILTRADFIYDFDFCKRLLLEYEGDPMNYATSWMLQMHHFVAQPCEANDFASSLDEFNWREKPSALLHNLNSRAECVSHIDGPNFCTSKRAMQAAGWYDETLALWGFNQQDLQTQMVQNGVKMKVIPECLAFHMHHAGPRDMDRAKKEWEKSPRRVPEILKEEARLKTADKLKP
jgi:hypothetical protein